MTTRGFTKEDFVKVANYIDKAVKLAVEIKNEVAQTGVKTKLADFKLLAQSNPQVQELRDEIIEWAKTFPVPGDL